MIQAYGLKTHIWNNNLRCVILLILFPVLLLFIAYAMTILYASFVAGMDTGEGLAYAANAMPAAVPVTLGVSGAWFGIAFMGHQKMIDKATHSIPMSPSEEPRAYRLLENLSISRGQTMPRLKIIETDVMNAFASGIRDKNYTVTLTRGLMDSLDDEELEAVIAHELSHIEHKDVRLLIIAIIFVGIFSFVFESVVRNMFRTNMRRNSHHRRSGGGNAGALIFFAIALIAVAYFLAMFVRFSLSRKREYMADAGAVELTKNPDAMIRALEKISGHAHLKSVPAEVREMAFENPKIGLAGMFATHPPIEKRIAALVKFGGGRLGTQSQPARRASSEGNSTRNESQKGHTRAKKPPFGRLNPWQK